MNNDEITKMFEHYRNFLNPVVKANKLSAAVLETLVYFHLYTLGSHVNIILPQMKEASVISNPQDLQAFLTQQAETISNLYGKFLDDTRTLSDLATNLGSKFDELIQENLRLIGHQNAQRYQKPLHLALKANDLSNTALEAFMDFHLHTLQSHTSLMMRQMQEASAIHDPQSLRAFLLQQAETISTLHGQILDETEALSGLATRLQAEFDELIQENLRLGNNPDA